MRATTSGATHKSEVELKKELTKTFFKKQKEQFSSLCIKKNVVYDKNTIINDPALNYINILPEDEIETSLKNIILSEYYHCEKIYPRLGDYLLFKLLRNQSVKVGPEFMFEKRHQNKLVKSINNPATTSIAEWIFENTNLNRNINVEKYFGDSIVVENLEEYLFNVDYDFSFYTSIKNLEIKNYRFVLINGLIETVGEIHHLLYKANENKEPYVIFCFGMSEEVKQTIIKNNALGRLRVYPVCFNTSDENNLNILNDLAVMHNSSVVSSDLGQTISQEIRKILPCGNKITFANGSFSILPVAKECKLREHRRFLRTRIIEAETKPDVRVDILKNRLKMFSGRRINFYIPDKLLKTSFEKRELDYYFRLISSLNKSLNIVSLNGQKFYIPNAYIKLADEKKDSLLKKMSEINAIVYSSS